MMADGRDRASLRAFFTHFVHEMDLGADLEAIEAGIQHTISVELEFPPVGRFKKTEALVGKEFGDSAVRQVLMRLQNSAASAEAMAPDSPASPPPRCCVSSGTTSPSTRRPRTSAACGAPLAATPA